MKKEVELPTLEDSQEFASNLGAKLKGGEVITLSSDLGGGKTTLIKSVVKGAGSKDLVSSPTFTICNTYKTPSFSIQHFDFYRLNDPGIMKLELEEALNDELSVVLIEWPKLIESVLPDRTVKIEVSVTSENGRKLTIDYPDELNYLFMD